MESRSLVNASLMILLAGFLLDDLAVVLFCVFAILQVLFLPILTAEATVQSQFIGRIVLVVSYIIAGIIIYSFRQSLIASRQEGEDIAGRERMKLADVNMQITRQAATRISLDEALNNALALILDNYPQLYHAQVFLIDADGVQAELRASTGEPGRILLERNHSLPVGSLSVIGQTTLAGEPVVAIANDPKSVHKVNPLLKDTTLEAAFPLQVEDRIIGALDLQSRTLTALSNDDRISFQSLANSLSLAIDNIRQFVAAQERIDENERLTERTRIMLSEVERLNRRLIGRAWTEYTAEHQDSLGYEVDLQRGDIQPYSNWSTSLQSAMADGKITRTGNVISVPLRIRGEIVGAMEFEFDGDLSDEQAILIEEVTERFGLAAENTRLVEESQRTAHRETLINQITSRFQAAQNVESTLTEAARSLSETLSAEKVMIRLGMPDKPTENIVANGEIIFVPSNKLSPAALMAMVKAKLDTIRNVNTTCNRRMR
ncbi:MAG: GAF domain-containing protein, partial [Chloroflexota bacterium]